MQFDRDETRYPSELGDAVTPVPRPDDGDEIASPGVWFEVVPSG